MPDDPDYQDLGALLAHPERWTKAEAEEARLLRKRQADAAASYDQRDRRRVTAMWRVVKELDEAIAAWEATR